MSFSKYTIYCAMRFLQSTIYGVLYHPVQCSKAVSEAVKGILKGSYMALILCWTMFAIADFHSGAP